MIFELFSFTFVATKFENVCFCTLPSISANYLIFAVKELYHANMINLYIVLWLKGTLKFQNTVFFYVSSVYFVADENDPRNLNIQR